MHNIDALASLIVIVPCAIALAIDIAKNWGNN